MTNIRTAINDNVNGSTFISITTSTTPTLRGGKSNPHLGRVQKVTVGSNVMIFQNKKTHGYDAMVKRRLAKEGKDPSAFNLSPRSWGHRVAGTPFVEHNGEYYLEVIFLHSGVTHFELDGNLISKRNVRGLPPTPEGGRQGGLNDKVVIRTFKVSSIESITISGREYKDLEYKS